MNGVAVLAGSISTALFVASSLPMLYKAARTKDLGSYSFGNMMLANVGNAVYAVYVFSMPPGPIWALHSFYTLSSALMMFWYLRYEVSRHRRVAAGVDQGAASEQPSETRRAGSRSAPAESPRAVARPASPGVPHTVAGRTDRARSRPSPAGHRRAPRTRSRAGHPGDDHRETSRSIVIRRRTPATSG